MKVLINSFFSEDENSTDGIYEIEIPKEYNDNYKYIISEIGCILDDINFDDLQLEDIEINNKEIEQFVNDNWDRFVDLADNEGSTLERTLIALKWNFERLNFDHSYDADYCRFIY